MSPKVASPPTNPYRSTSQVSAPRRAAATAAAMPADPAPTTSTSGDPITGRSRAGSRHVVASVSLTPMSLASGPCLSFLGGPRPRLTPARLRHHDLRRDVGARGADRRRSTSARASPTPTGPARWPTPRSPPSAPATTSTRRGRASPSCATAIAEHQQRFYGLEHDPDTEVLVTAGATEAIAASMLALCEPGDEVVMFEPYYDSYAASIAMAGAERRVVAAPTARTTGSTRPTSRPPSRRRRGLLLLNSPHNPTGKVFSPDELDVIAGALRRARPDRRHRRGVRAPRVRRRARPARDAARDARPHGDDLARRARRSRSPAGRSGGRAARPRSSTRCGPRSSS